MTLSSRTATSSIKSLYLSAFPKEERYPYLLLKLLALRPQIHFCAYAECAEEKPIGFSYTIEGEKMVFILYLAVDAASRSQGYGSEILGILKNRYPGKSLTLNIEPLDKTAENFAERMRRFAFYEKNGFLNTGCVLTDSTMTYTVLSTAEDFTIKEYQQTLTILHPFGFGMPAIGKRKN